MNLRVRRVTGESESAILVSCGRVDDQDREVQQAEESEMVFVKSLFFAPPAHGAPSNFGGATDEIPHPCGLIGCKP